MSKTTFKIFFLASSINASFFPATYETMLEVLNSGEPKRLQEFRDHSDKCMNILQIQYYKTNCSPSFFSKLLGLTTLILPEEIKPIFLQNCKKAAEISFLHLMLALKFPDKAWGKKKLDEDQVSTFNALKKAYVKILAGETRFFSAIFCDLKNAFTESQLVLKSQTINLIDLVPNMLISLAMYAFTTSPRRADRLQRIQDLTECWAGLAQETKPHLEKLKTELRFFLLQQLETEDQANLKVRILTTVLNSYANDYAMLEALNHAENCCQICFDPILLDRCQVKIHPSEWLHSACYAQATAQGQDADEYDAVDDQSFQVPGTGKKAGCPLCRELHPASEIVVTADPHKIFI